MIRIAVLAVIASLSATSLTAEPCNLKNNFCVPFVACVLDGKEFFFGKSFGRRSGPVQAVSPSGAICEGQWWRTALGAGRTEFSCKDGRKGKGTFTYFDSKTGTATGRGRTSDGQRLRVWAGADISKYVLSGAEKDLDLIECVQSAISAGK